MHAAVVPKITCVRKKTYQVLFVCMGGALLKPGLSLLIDIAFVPV